jgi:hypothetical protein
MGRSLPGRVSVLVAGAAWACACIAGVACGGDDAATEPSDGGAADGPAIVVDASLPDASAGDGGAEPSDASDGASEAEAAPPKDAGPYCTTLSPQPTFCDDFDLVDLTPKWDQKLAVSTSTIARDGAIVTSGSMSLLAKSTGTNVASPVTALVRKTLAGAPTRVRFGFAMRPEAAAPPSGNLWYATLDLSINHLLTFYLRDAAGSPALVEQAAGGIEVRTPLALPPRDAWTRVEIDADMTAKKLTVRYDGAKVVDAIDLADGVLDPTERLGVMGNGPSDPYVARFEDVVFDLTP